MCIKKTSSIKILSVFVLVLIIKCSSDPIGHDKPIDLPSSGIKLILPDTIKNVEGLFQLNYSFVDSTGLGHRVDAFYGYEHIGVDLQPQKNGHIITGKMWVNLYEVPENSKIFIRAYNDASQRDSVGIIPRQNNRYSKEYYSTYHGGVLNGSFNAIRDGVVVQSGDTWIVTDGGLLIVHSDLSINTYEYNGFDYNSAYLRYIVLNEFSEARFIDSRGYILKWDGSNFVALGRFQFAGDYFSVASVAYFDSEYFAISSLGPGIVYRYNENSNTTLNDTITDYSYEGICINEGPNNSVVAGFESYYGSNVSKIFILQNNNWNEIDPPVGETTGITDFTLDNTGVLWVSFNYGLYHYNGINFIKTELPQTFQAVGPHTTCLYQGKLMDLCFDTNDDLWIAASTCGLFRISSDNICLYSRTSLSDKFTSCSSEYPTTTKVFRGSDGGIFSRTYGFDIGSILKYFSAIQNN